MKVISRLIFLLTITALCFAVSGCGSCNCSGNDKNKRQTIIHKPIKWEGFKDNAKIKDPDADACTDMWQNCYSLCMEKYTDPVKQRAGRCYRMCYARSLLSGDCTRYQDRKEREELRENSPYQELDPRYFEEKKREQFHQRRR